MAEEHPVGVVVRFWMVVNTVILILITLVWLFLLYDYPRIYSIFVVSPGTVVNAWRFGMVIGLLIVSTLGLYGFVTNERMFIHLFLGAVSITLMILHVLIYLNSSSDASFSPTGLLKNLVGVGLEKAANWKPAAEMGVDKIKQLALNASTGLKLNIPFVSKDYPPGPNQAATTTGPDYLPFSSMILGCCGPYDEGHGPRRICYREDMPMKNSICSPFYMTVGALNHVALIVLTTIFWFIHALSSLKLISHKLPGAKKNTDGQTYIVPEGRVKSYDKSDYSGTVTGDQISPV